MQIDTNSQVCAFQNYGKLLIYCNRIQRNVLTCICLFIWQIQAMWLKTFSFVAKGNCFVRPWKIQSIFLGSNLLYMQWVKPDLFCIPYLTMKRRSMDCPLGTNQSNSDTFKSKSIFIEDYNTARKNLHILKILRKCIRRWLNIIIIIIVSHFLDLHVL